MPNGRNTYDIGKALRRHLRNVVVTIEKGIGHYLFNHRDSEGRSAVLRELLALEGVDTASVPAMIRQGELKFEALSNVDRLNYNFEFDPLFRSWVMQNYGKVAFKKAVQRDDRQFMKGIELRFAKAVERRHDDIRKLIFESAERDPEFGEENKVVLEKMKKSKDTSLFLKYADYFEALSKPRK